MSAQLPSDSKIVAVLLTDVVSSTEHLTSLGDEAGNAQRARHFALLRAELQEHGGTEVKNMGDGILAVFPSAVDAVQCATAMQQAVERDRREHPADGVRMKVGLHVGEPVHEEDDFFGAAMVLVTRLCSAAAPGQILASELLRALVAPRRDLVFEPVGPLELKGLPEPVAAYSVPWTPLGPTTYLDPLAVPRAGSRFVDRATQRAALARWFETASSGQRTLGLIAGEPGIGKTRLVAEAALAAHEVGATVLWGRSFEEALAPHGAFVEALRRLFAWVEGREGLEGVEAAADHLVSLSPVFAPGGEDPAAAQQAAAPRGAHDQGADRLRLFDAVDAVLHELASLAPVVLVLDDLQWADEATLMLLAHLVRSPQPDRLLILGTYREGEADRSRPLAALLADLRREHRLERVRLGGLGDDASADLVESLLEELTDLEVPDEVLRRVNEQTDGNPFFIEEVVRHLVESGLVERFAGDATAAPDLDRIDLPEGVTEVVGRRLSRLGPDANQVLGVAAVVGREFDLSVVEEVSRLDRDVVVDALDEAVRAGLVAEDPDTVGRFQFTHALVRRTLTDELSATRRARLHQRIAETMEPDVTDEDDVTVVGSGEAERRRLIEVAHHSLAAVPLGDPWRAARHVRRAGDRVLAELAYEQAAALFDAALVTLDGLTPPNREARELRAQVVLGAGEARVLAGDLEGAKAAFRRSIEDAAALGDGELRARAALGFGTALGSGVGFEFGLPSSELVQLLRDALEGLPEGDSEMRAMLTARLGAALASSVDPSDAVPTARAALEMAERLGSPATVAFCLNAMRAAAWARIDREEQRQLTDRLVHAAIVAGDALLELQGRVWQVAEGLEDGDPEAVELAHADLVALVDRLRLPQYRWYLELYGATRALIDGDVGRAEQLSLQALERGGPLGDLNVDLAFGGQTYLQWVERGWLDQLVPIAEEQVARLPTVAAWRAALAQALAAAGRDDEARELLRSTLAEVATAPPEPLRNPTLASLTDVARRLGDTTSAAELHELMLPEDGQMATIAQMAGFDGAMSHHLGVAAMTAGELDRAEVHLRRAAEQHARLGAPGWEARSVLLLAEVLLRRDRRQARPLAEGLVHRAAALVEGHDLPEVRRELERVGTLASREEGAGRALTSPA